MDFNHKLDKILQDIQEIENYTVDFKNARSIPKIEMDILTEKVRNLYDELLQIDRNYPYESPERGKITSSKRKEAPTTKQEEQKRAPESNKEATTEAPAESKAEQQERKQKEKEKQQATEASKATENKKQDTTTAGEDSGTRIQYEDQSVEESKTVNRPDQGKEDMPEILADRFHNTKTSMHDNLAKKQSQNDLSSKMQSKPIQDLNKAIGLNDRFLFIRELFNGNKDAYYEAIQIINEMPNYEEAEQYIRERFNWDEEQPEVMRFMDLVRRRFIS
jgi:hypothetical protein